MGVHRGRGGEADRLADLAHRGRVAPLALAVGDEGEDLQPLPAQDLGHRRLLVSCRRAHPAFRRAPPGGEHPFVTDQDSQAGEAKANICSVQAQSEAAAASRWTPSSARSRSRSVSKVCPPTRRRARQVDRDVDGDAPLAEHEHPVGQQDRLLDVVGDEEHAGPVQCAQVGHQVLHLEAGQRVEGRRRGPSMRSRPGLTHQSSVKGLPLRLAARERAGPRVSACRSGQPRTKPRSPAWVRNAAGSPVTTMRQTRIEATRRGPDTRRY